MKLKKILFVAILITVILIVASLKFLKSYIACGCGGCGGMKPAISFTLTPKKIITENESFSKSENCQSLGCSMCIKYYYFEF